MHIGFLLREKPDLLHNAVNDRCRLLGKGRHICQKGKQQDGLNGSCCVHLVWTKLQIFVCFAKRVVAFFRVLYQNGVFLRNFFDHSFHDGLAFPFISDCINMHSTRKRVVFCNVLEIKWLSMGFQKCHFWLLKVALLEAKSSPFAS